MFFHCRYLELYCFVDSEPLSSLGWKKTFKRFLHTPPSCQDDFALLLMVLKFLLFLLSEYCISAETYLYTFYLSYLQLCITYRFNFIRPQWLPFFVYCGNVSLFFVVACPSQSEWVTQALQTSPHTILNLIIAANSAVVRDTDEQEMVCLLIL